jgi:protein-tyrosine phosphatase
MFSNVRYYLPDSVSNNMMYYLGQTRCYLQQYVNNTFSANNITDDIFIGNMASASNYDEMKKNGITHILSVFNGAYELFPGDFSYKIIHINDDPWVDISKHFEESNEFIDCALNDTKNKNKVMIHCKQGVSRSVTLLVAYILYKINTEKKISKENVDNMINNVLKNVQLKRPMANPNEGFLDCLRKYIYKINKY